MEKNKAFYTIKEVERITGLTKDTIRNWCKDFNIQLEKTEGGHRRFSEENIQVLKSIEEKKEVNGWSMKQIGAWLSGELTPEVLAGTEVRTNLEKKFDSLEETILEEMGEMKKVIAILAKELAERDRKHEQEKLETEHRHKQEMELMIDVVEKKIADPVEGQMRKLTNSLTQSMEQTKLEIAAAKEKKETEQELHKQKEKLGPVSRFFAKFGL